MKLTLETSGGPSRALWFIIGAVSGFIFAVAVIANSLAVVFNMGTVE